MTTPFIVDSHCHLDFPELQTELPNVLARAKAAGVRLCLTISTRVKQFDRLRAIVEENDNVWCTIGTHPHNADEEPDVTPDNLLRIAEHPKVVGIGECGLDYHYKTSTPEGQARSFRRHIEAARVSGLPLVVHSREAEDDTAAILEDEMGKGAFRPILHCFSSKKVLAERGLAIGAHVSFSGIVTFKSATEIQETARIVPTDRILVETDAPYLAPVPMRGKTNEPSYVAHTLKFVAGLRSVDENRMAQETTDNFFNLFLKVKRP
ncbi:MAG: TatD family hydrolase [Hyphomicrobiales bacterium]